MNIRKLTLALLLAVSCSGLQAMEYGDLFEIKNDAKLKFPGKKIISLSARALSAREKDWENTDVTLVNYVMWIEGEMDNDCEKETCEYYHSILLKEGYRQYCLFSEKANCCFVWDGSLLLKIAQGHEVPENFKKAIEQETKKLKQISFGVAGEIDREKFKNIEKFLVTNDESEKNMKEIEDLLGPVEYGVPSQ